MPEPTVKEDGSTGDSSRSVGALLGRLAEDGRALLQQEIELAKIEVQDTALRLARSSAFIAGGVLFLGLGLVVLLVFAVLALGRILGGEYWLSSLIIGVLFAGLGAVLMAIGKRGARRDELKPTKTIASARETTEWARTEVQDLKRDLRP